MVSLQIGVSYSQKDFETQTPLRADICQKLQEIGQELHIHQRVIANACIYFHLFFARISDPETLATLSASLVHADEAPLTPTTTPPLTPTGTSSNRSTTTPVVTTPVPYLLPLPITALLPTPASSSSSSGVPTSSFPSPVIALTTGSLSNAALTCLYIAAKADEEKPPRKGDWLEVISRRVRRGSNAPQDAQTQRQHNYKLMELQEQAILRVIEFTFDFPDPYTCLLDTLYRIYCDYCCTPEMIPAVLNTPGGVCKTAWHFVNDSLKTTLCLQFSAQLIAVAALYLTFQLRGIRIVRGKQRLSPSDAVPSWKRSAELYGQSEEAESEAKEGSFSETNVWYVDLYGINLKDILEACDQILLCVESTCKKVASRQGEKRSRAGPASNAHTKREAKK